MGGRLGRHAVCMLLRRCRGALARGGVEGFTVYLLLLFDVTTGTRAMVAVGRNARGIDADVNVCGSNREITGFCSKDGISLASLPINICACGANAGRSNAVSAKGDCTALRLGYTGLRIRVMSTRGGPVDKASFGVCRSKGRVRDRCASSRNGYAFCLGPDLGCTCAGGCYSKNVRVPRSGTGNAICLGLGEGELRVATGCGSVPVGNDFALCPCGSGRRPTDSSTCADDASKGVAFGMTTNRGC